MRINSIINCNNKYENNTFKALKLPSEMEWDSRFWASFSKKAQLKFDNFEYVTDKNPDKVNFFRELYLYWMNIADSMYNAFWGSDGIKNSALKEIKVSDNEEKAISQFYNYLSENSYNSTLEYKELIKKVSEYPEIAGNSYIQDSILSIIKLREVPDKNRLNLIDLILSNKYICEDKNLLWQMWHCMTEYTDNESIEIMRTIVSNPILYKNKDIQKVIGSVLLNGDNIKSSQKILNTFAENPVLKNNKSIKNNIGIIIHRNSVEKIQHAENLLNMYLNTQEMQQDKWIKNNIGNLCALIDNKNSEIIYKTVSTPSLYDNSKYTSQLTEIINLIKTADFINEDIYIEILNKIIGNPAFYENNYVIGNLKEIIDCNMDLSRANNKLTFMDKYASNEKYYTNKNLQSTIPALINSANYVNINFLTEIMDDIVSKKPKRTFNENFAILTNSNQRFFGNIKDYEDFKEIRKDSVNHLKALSTFGNPVNEERILHFFDDFPDSSCLLKVLGKEAFIKAYGLKYEELNKFSNHVHYLVKSSPDFFEAILQKTNLKDSKNYILLTQKLKKLKNGYTKVLNDNNPQELENLQFKINKVSHLIREMERKEIKDAQFKINLLRQISQMAYPDAKEMLNLVERGEVKSKSRWNEIMLKNVLRSLNISYDKKLIKKLGLEDSINLDKILISTDAFKNNLKDIVNLLMFYPDKTVEETFNDLPQNKATRRLFENEGADYDKWVKFDKNSKIEIFYDKGKKFVFRKVNMNDIMYSLFLGNYASCCMKAGGGTYSGTAPNYIKNKFISAIEVLDGNKPVGNTICYLALVNDRPALILDNISLQPEYRDVDIMRKGFLAYAKKLCTEIGLNGIPVYTTSSRHGIKISDNPEIEQGDFVFLGSSGSDYVYIDDITEAELIKPNQHFEKNLYNFENIEPDDADGVDPVRYANMRIQLDDVLNGNIPDIYYWNPALPAEDYES